jgi:tRNA nucleotidyltransferase (CCA-adding enzyme)
MAQAANKRIKRLISNYFIKLKGTKIQLRGRDLVSMGFKPGPIFREIFEHLLEARLNNLVKTKEDELKFVRDKFEKA